MVLKRALKSSNLFYFRVQKSDQLDSPQCPLSKHVSPLCERTNHHLIRSMRSDLETTVVKGRELAPWGLSNAAVMK